MIHNLNLCKSTVKHVLKPLCIFTDFMYLCENGAKVKIQLGINNQEHEK